MSSFLSKWRKSKGDTAEAPSSTTPPAQTPSSPAAVELGKVLEEVRVLKKAGKLAEAADILSKTYLQKENPVVGYRLIATLIELRRYEAILEYPSARPYNSRDYAVAERLVLEDASRTTPLCLTTHEAWDSLGYVTMVKDEQDIILFNLVWHYALGVRRFFVIDNLSTDRTGELIRVFQERFPDASVQILHDSVVAHFQGRKVSGACWFLKSLWPELEWVILADADEFICAESPLRELLAGIAHEVDAIVLPKSVYRLTPGDPADDSDFFFRRLTRRQPLSHVSTKIIARARVGIEIAQGNHRVFEHKGYTTSRNVAVPGLTMREYPIRTLAQFQRKIVSGSRAIQAAKQAGLEAVGGDHWIGMHKVLVERGPAALAAKMDGEIVANAQRATLSDALPLGSVMDQLLPDWRSVIQP